MKTSVNNIWFTLMMYSPFWRIFVKKNYLYYLSMADFYPENSIYGRRVRLLASKITECRTLYSRYSFFSHELLCVRKETAEMPSSQNNRIWGRLLDEKIRLAKLRKNSVSPILAPPRLPLIPIISTALMAALVLFFFWYVPGSWFLRNILLDDVNIAQHQWHNYYILQANRGIHKPTDPLFTEHINNPALAHNHIKFQLKLEDQRSFLISQTSDYAARLEADMGLLLRLRIELLGFMSRYNSKTTPTTPQSSFFWQELELRPIGTTFIVSTGRHESAVTLLKGELLVIDHKNNSQWVLKPKDALRKRSQHWQLVRQAEKEISPQSDVIQVFLQKMKDADEAPLASKVPAFIKKRLRITLSNGTVVIGQKLTEGRNYFLLNISGSEIQVAKKDISKIDYIP